MCGIIAVVRRRTTRPPPAPDVVLARLQPLAGQLDDLAEDILEQLLAQTAVALEDVNALLSGVPGVQMLLTSPHARHAITSHAREVDAALTRIDRDLDTG